MIRKITKSATLFSAFFFVIIHSCNPPGEQVQGKYKVKEVKRPLSSNYMSIELLHLKSNGNVDVVYPDTVIFGHWKEVDVEELNYVKLSVGGKLHELYINKDSAVELSFLNLATDFRGGFSDSVTFIKIK